MNKVKCSLCKKKVKLHEQIKCKCNLIFCPNHRLCHQHNCIVGIDKKNNIQKENPKIINTKIEVI